LEERKGKQCRSELRWLHHGSRLLLQGRRQSHVGSSVAARRSIQRRNLAANLISQPLAGWDVPKESGQRFWRALRFGGAGFILAWLLAQL
jgi:hypothetical protein